jgi:hypothetical protein
MASEPRSNRSAHSPVSVVRVASGSIPRSPVTNASYARRPAGARQARNAAALIIFLQIHPRVE